MMGREKGEKGRETEEERESIQQMVSQFCLITMTQAISVG